MSQEAEWQNLIDLVKQTWRGGPYASYWYLSADGERKYSQWFSRKHAELPGEDKEGWHIYFGVHPTMQAGTKSQRSRKETVAAVNCLFSDFDAKDEVPEAVYRQYLPEEYETLPTAKQHSAVKRAQEQAMMLDLAKYKRDALAKVHRCPLQPSWVLDSGGGFQVYWFLAQTVLLNEENRDRVALLQKEWVRLVGGGRGRSHLDASTARARQLQPQSLFWPRFSRGEGGAARRYTAL